MKKQIYSSKIFGSIAAPVSKSVMQRALAASLLDRRKVVLRNAGNSNDDVDTMKVVERLGAKIEMGQDNSLTIQSQFDVNFKPNDSILNFGESGLATRLFTPLVALLNDKFVLEGRGSLEKRPLGIPEEIFPSINVKFGSRTGRLPFRVKGPLSPASVHIQSIPSSQFLSGLLLAYSYKDASDVEIEIADLKSYPYIDLTLQVMEDFGMKMPIVEGYRRFYFPVQPHERPTSGVFDYTVENDWSNAAMIFVAGATAGEVRVTGLNLSSKQGDKVVLEVLKKAGAVVEAGQNEVLVRRGTPKAFDFDATHFPDLFPPLVALAANCPGTSTITGVERLRSKESNRSKSLQYEFGRLGVDITLEDNRMLVKGGPISGGVVKSHNDHRVAMALSVAGLAASGRVEVVHTEAVNKSYPYFYADLRSLNANIQ